jgi:hypothetical protein
VPFAAAYTASKFGLRGFICLSETACRRPGAVWP